MSKHLFFYILYYNYTILTFVFLHISCYFVFQSQNFHMSVVKDAIVMCSHMYVEVTGVSPYSPVRRKTRDINYGITAILKYCVHGKDLFTGAIL